MRDEPLAIRREISLERSNDRRQHAAYTLACRKNVDYSIVRHFLILPSSF
jgi:hypothetical protein